MKNSSDEKTHPVKQLREATKDEHVKLEEQLMDRFFEGGSKIRRSDYIQLLQSFYGLYRTLEPALVDAIGRHLNAYDYNRRTEYLKTDLRQLGLNADDLEKTPEMPDSSLIPINSTARLLGALYVIEGSELGAQSVMELLRNHLSEETLKATAYYGRSPDEAHRRWETYQERLNREMDGEESLHRAVDSARQTFHMFREWME